MCALYSSAGAVSVRRVQRNTLLRTCCRCCGLFLLVVGERLRQCHLCDDHAIAISRIGVGHWHVRTKSRPLDRVTFRINNSRVLAVVILHRFGARFRAKHDVARPGSVSGNCARAI
jgi:hypothetical protein